MRKSIRLIDRERAREIYPTSSTRQDTMMAGKRKCGWEMEGDKEQAAKE